MLGWGRGVRRPLLRLISTSAVLLAQKGVSANPLLTPAHKLFGEKFNQKPTAQTSAPCAELAIGNFCSAKVIFIGDAVPLAPLTGGSREVGLCRRGALAVAVRLDETAGCDNKHKNFAAAT